jgi:hypothetical protein
LQPGGNYERITHEPPLVVGYYIRRLVHLVRHRSLSVAVGDVACEELFGHGWVGVAAKFNVPERTNTWIMRKHGVRKRKPPDWSPPELWPGLLLHGDAHQDARSLRTSGSSGVGRLGDHARHAPGRAGGVRPVSVPSATPPAGVGALCSCR